jgi:hypothetical protein
MSDINLYAVNQDGANDVRLYSVVSGVSPIAPLFVTVYLYPIGGYVPTIKSWNGIPMQAIKTWV